MNTNIRDRMRTYAPVIIRIGLALVLLWFGSQQLLNTNSWIGIIPDLAVQMSGLEPATLVHMNGAFEVIFGFCLLIGFFTRIVSFFLALHMIVITITVGYNSVGVRDFGLSMAAISSFLYGKDAFSLDRFLEKRNILL